MAEDTTETDNQIARNRHIEELVYLQEILPIKVWKCIFDNLKDPVDLTNVSTASPVFRRLLEARRVEYLFPAVWDVLALHYHKAGESQKSKPEKVQLVPLSIEVNIKWYTDILAARAVCHTWKKAIDDFNFFEALPAIYAKRGGKYALAGTLFDSRWAADPFRADPLTLPKFVQHFKATHADSKCEFNPFLTKRFAVSYAKKDTRPINAWITQVLQTYGRHVLICEFTMDFCRVTRDTFAILRQWLSLVPNIISLTIVCYGRIVEDICVNMKVISRRQRLPKLDKLEHIHLFMCSPPLVDLFRQTYEHVEFFENE